MSTRLAAAVFFLSIVMTAPAAAVECRSRGGHMEGEPVVATRSVMVRNGMMTISGTMQGKPSPRRTLTCRALARGVWCERRFGPVNVTITTNRRRMIETVTSLDGGAELAGIAYGCDGEILLK